MTHQFINRESGQIITENLFFDTGIRTIYSTCREKAHWIYNLLLSSRASAVLGFLNYDLTYLNLVQQPQILLKRLGVNTAELADTADTYTTCRKVFERRIRYWECRDMPQDPDCLVSPADSKVLPGSFNTTQRLFIKEKFFDFRELIGHDKADWQSIFKNGDFIICRLTPEKYHYNHAPVSGKVVDFYEINGKFHSCNPGAVVRSVTPYSKNRRVVTIIDTDVKNGTGAGHVAMIEIVAMMIGQIRQCYSENKYISPQQIKTGDFLEKGQPKSLFRPGSSTTVLIFEKNRVQLSADLLANRNRPDVISRFSEGFCTPLVETELNVREIIGTRIK